VKLANAGWGLGVVAVAVAVAVVVMQRLATKVCKALLVG
jgi:type II secretory ATPase GspE/PulE/Tfp pilus assembly ATPase PilB-like protein